MKTRTSFKFIARNPTTMLISGGILFLLIAFGVSFVSSTHALGAGLIGVALLLIGIFFHYSYIKT